MSPAQLIGASADRVLWHRMVANVVNDGKVPQQQLPKRHIHRHCSPPRTSCFPAGRRRRSIGESDDRRARGGATPPPVLGGTAAPAAVELGRSGAGGYATACPGMLAGWLLHGRRRSIEHGTCHLPSTTECTPNTTTAPLGFVVGQRIVQAGSQRGSRRATLRTYA